MSLLDDISSDLVNESASLANTLRKAKILASQIGLAEFRQWVDLELSGYLGGDKAPDYRRFPATNLGTYSGPMGGGISNAVLPTFNLPDPVKQFAENLVFLEGVGALEALANQEATSHQIKWPQEYVLLSREATRMSGGMVLVDAHIKVPSYAVSGILDNVKNKLLDFILSLQENQVTPESLNTGAVDQDAVRNLFYVNIYGDHNMVASGEKVTQQTHDVREGDMDSLLGYLTQLNVSSDDIEAIRQAVAQEAPGVHREFGPKVKSWLGEMVAKAASRTWNVGIDEGPKLLIGALKAYFGS